MEPAKPPLPTPMNFPFQFWTGSHSSMLIRESDVGFSVRTRLTVSHACHSDSSYRPASRAQRVVPMGRFRRGESQRGDGPWLIDFLEHHSDTLQTRPSEFRTHSGDSSPNYGRRNTQP